AIEQLWINLRHTNPLIPQTMERSGRGARDGVVPAQGKDLVAAGGDQNGMFPLGGELAILGDCGPAVTEQACFGTALVDHRLDGERHAFLEFHAGPRTAVVQYLRLLVEDLADAMAAVFAHDGEAVLFGVFLDRLANVAQAN